MVIFLQFEFVLYIISPTREKYLFFLIAVTPKLFLYWFLLLNFSILKEKFSWFLGILSALCFHNVLLSITVDCEVLFSPDQNHELFHDIL